MKTARTRNRVAAALARTAASAAVFFALACGSEEPAATTSTDDVGRGVAVPARITRVVTLSPNITEMLFAIGAGDRIVGADDFSNYPKQARALTRVGGMQPNIEKIVTLRPELVLASTEGNHPNLVPALTAANIPLFVLRTDRIEEIPLAMSRLASMMDVDAERVIADFRNAIAAEKRTRTHPPRVLFAVWTDPLYVGGRDTFTDDILKLTGAQNVVQVTGWPQYSLESLVAAPPDLFLYPRGAVTPEQIAALQKRVPEMRAEIVAVDEDIFQRPGPRVVEAAKRLNGILDAFEARRSR